MAQSSASSAVADDLSDGLIPKSRTAAGQPVALGPGITGSFHGDPADLDKVVIEQPLASARPDDFRDGLVAKKTAKTTLTSASSASSLVTPGKGVYQMRDQQGKEVPVSYDHVIDQIHKGFNFADKKTLRTFAADHAADPQNSNNRSDATIAAMSNWNPLKYLASIGAGVQDVLEGAGGEVMKAATAFDRPAASSGETSAQLSAQTPVQNVGQGTGALGEQVGELAVMPEVKGPEAATLAAKAGRVALQAGRGAAEQGGQALVRGEGDMALQAICEILPYKEIELVAPLPRDLAAWIDMSTAVSARAVHRADALRRNGAVNRLARQLVAEADRVALYDE